MKCLKLFLIVFTLFLFSCTVSDNNYETMNAIVRKAESIYQHPDGKRIDSNESDTLQLSLELVKAADYFAANKDYWKAAKAYLLCGYSHKEYKDKTSAMKAFKNAEHYGSTVSDSLTMARAQFNIARFLFEENAYDELLTTSLLAEKNFGIHHSECAYVENLLASSYILRKDYNNAELCLKRAYALAEKGHSSQAKRKVLNNYSVFYREQGDYVNAMNCLRLNIVGADSTDLPLAYSNIGTIHLYNNQYDSAAYYMHKSLDISKSFNTKNETLASIYFSLYYIYKNQGIYQKALEYFEQYNQIQYNYQKDKEKKNLYRIQRQYDYEALQNRMNQEIIEKQRIILMISYLLLLAAIVVIGLLVRQRKILKEDERIKKELDITKEELQKSSVKAEVVEEELSRELRLIITANHIARQADDFKKEWSTLVYKINHEKDNMFGAAVAAIERVYPSMYDSIIKKYPALNETESKVMLLSCSDLTNKEIAHILNLSIHTVNKSRSEINKKISSLMEVNASSADKQ